MTATAYPTAADRKTQWLREQLARPLRYDQFERTVEKVRDRTSLAWWERAAEIDDCMDIEESPWRGRDFLDYLSSGGPVHCLPHEVTSEIGDEMFDAAREAAYGVSCNSSGSKLPKARALTSTRWLHRRQSPQLRRRDPRSHPRSGSVHLVTVYTQRQIMCDAQECNAVAPKIDSVTDLSRVRARELAAKKGWTERDGKDFCPDHGGAQQ